MRSLRAFLSRHRVVSFFVLAYAISWSFWIPMAVRGGVVTAGDGWPTHLLGLLGPAVAALVVTALTEGRRGLTDLIVRMGRWRGPGRWWLVVAGTLAIPPLAGLVPLVTGASSVPPWGDFFRYTGIGMIGPVGVVLVALFVNGFGAETGWRGFAVGHLQRSHNLTGTALGVTRGSAGWPLPMFYIVDSFRQMGPFALGWVVGLVAGSVVLTYLYMQGRHSILFVAAWHTAFNLTSATAATGAVVGTVTSIVVIAWAVWILRHDDRHIDDGVAELTPD